MSSSNPSPPYDFYNFKSITYNGPTGTNYGSITIDSNSNVLIGSTGTGSTGTNTIILNATGANLNGATGNALYIAPIRVYDTSDLGTTGGLIYNLTSKQITYSTTKTFVIDHPLDNSKYLVHGCLEGPEAGVYYRGKSIIENDFVEITLPDYVSDLATDFTIQLTPIYSNEHTRNRDLICSEIENNSFKVYGYPGPFYWHVYGMRNAITVEPFKDSVELKGDGPYKYI